MDAGPGAATPNSREDAVNELSRVYEKSVARFVQGFAAIRA